MKNIYSFLLAVCFALGCTCCDDFLTTLPESDYSADGSYRSQADFEYAIAAVYAAQQELYQPNNSWFRAMIGRSDDTRNGSTYMYGLDQFTDNANVDILTSSWKYFWQIISRANLILDKIDAIEFKDENTKQHIKGEAYALRAWSYYTLGWQYGGMPLIDREMTVNETKTVARSSQDETFDFATADYKKAIELLPDTWSSTHAGRVTKNAAKGGLARLYMFRSDFSSAKPLLADIINSGLYKMESDYRDCFTDSKDNGSERVWEVQFNGNQSGEGQAFSTGMLPEGYTDGVIIPFSGYSTAMLVSKNMDEAYEEDDLRKDLSIVTDIMVNGALQSTHYYIIKYCHYDAYTPQDKNDWANNLPILRYTDVKMMYAECLNEEGYMSNGDAFNILNEVRSRAGLPALTSAEVPDQAAFRNAIIKERRVEFAFEGLRWNDLVRWGIATEVINKHFTHEDEGKGLYSMQDYRKIFAIPYNEISRYNDESVMWQNPQY